ncbi:hypothetical protein ACFO8O_10000 [Hephaestia sp. GCM10023244]|uniref:oxidoreductase n=1 Tax=unclassified Hephaestia TaxID=2631281 RepID=UPI0020775B55|nr:hypothetical protein [Hephaestia sp. MAHUQ-44]MCM8731292.1 hypothetical protein [Hephaestia sp. MAHUQ-44]
MTNAIATSSTRRIFFLGVNTGYVTKGVPDDRYVDFYQRRASPQIYCAIVGNVVVPGGHGSNASTPTLTDRSIWAKIASAIAEGGTIPGIQLATAWEGYVGTRKFIGAEPHHVIAAARHLINELDLAGTAMALSAFDEAARMAVDHGFRHVQLHGAHGYLLSLMIDSRINPNAEKVLDRLSSLAERLASDGIESSIRISLRTGDVGFDAEGAYAFQNRIASLPFDYVDLSSGFYNIDKRLIYPSRPKILSSRLQESRAIALRFPHKAFIFSGRAMLNDEGRFPANLHIGLCRDLIANPHFLSNPHNGCQNRNKCHYFSRGEDHLTCALWGESNT